MTDVLTEKKTRPSRTYIVLSDCLGTHQRKDAPELRNKLRYDEVTTEELGPNCDVERLVKLRAITPKIAMPGDPVFDTPIIPGFDLPYPERPKSIAPPVSIAEAAGPKVKWGQPPKDW